MTTTPQERCSVYQFATRLQNAKQWPARMRLAALAYTQQADAKGAGYEPHRLSEMAKLSESGTDPLEGSQRTILAALPATKGGDPIRELIDAMRQESQP